MAFSVALCIWWQDILPVGSSIKGNLSSKLLFGGITGGRFMVVDQVDNVDTINVLNFFKVDRVPIISVGKWPRADKEGSIRVAGHQCSKGVVG